MWRYEDDCVEDEDEEVSKEVMTVGAMWNSNKRPVLKVNRIELTKVV